MQDKRKQQLQGFCDSLGIHMHDLELLDMALTHTSYAHEAKQTPKPQHNERIEFLGDSVLSVIVSTYMYQNFPDLAEGQLTKLRAHLVCETSLFEYAKKINLGAYLRLGKGEELSGGRERPSILADAFESVLGAIYLDLGFEKVQSYLLAMMRQEIDYICRHGIYNDYKTRLQEFLQRDGDVDISYQLMSSTGPEHNKVFTSEVMVQGRVIGEGKGRTKKDSEQHAAQQALAQLHVQTPK
ncbi:MAG: ribonuclease III [Phascolarctobacterium sp.]|uniref:ribonuclease III n=1 Tax=Phascolarctobacterium sp. TaxID=2049039 RepID=UPI0026DC1DEA|nr:ribonuclease III [Phascolarctobacterium sp.]MDO4920765.1 ribonuclease III [Phascolarctobacterium sp.]